MLVQWDISAKVCDTPHTSTLLRVYAMVPWKVVEFMIGVLYGSLSVRELHLTRSFYELSAFVHTAVSCRMNACYWVPLRAVLYA